MATLTMSSARTLGIAVLLATLAAALGRATAAHPFGGAYPELQPDASSWWTNWVARFTKLAKQSLAQGRSTTRFSHSPRRPRSMRSPTP